MQSKNKATLVTSCYTQLFVRHLEYQTRLLAHHSYIGFKKHLQSSNKLVNLPDSSTCGILMVELEEEDLDGDAFEVAETVDGDAASDGGLVAE